jgi:hypothetical protein
MEKVVSMAVEKLDRLTTKFKAYLEQDTKNRQEWIEIQIAKCMTLAEMRDQFPGNVEFSRWWNNDSGLNDVVNSNMRAAMIAMGSKPDDLREVLGKTARNALEQIYRENRTRFGGVPKTTSTKKDKPKKPNPAPASDKAYQYIVETKNEGKKVEGKKKIAEKLGVSHTSVEKAVYRIKCEENEDSGTESSPAPVKAEAWQISERKRLRQEIYAEVKAELSAAYQEMLNAFSARVDWAEKIMESYRGVMSKQEYLTVVKCLHPDTNADEELKREAFRCFTQYKDVLVKPEVKFSGPALPTSASELMARRKTKW